jgi:two-component system cell cycle response regulator DivK
VARILVVEDDPQNLRLIVSLLRVLGHDPIPATTGAEAVDIAAGLAADSLVDLALIDIQMPEMDGFKTARALHALPSLSDVPLVAVTALGPDESVRVLEGGFSGYISKPLDVGRLPGQLAAFLPGPDR